MATGDLKRTLGTPKTLEANGSSTADATIQQANDASYSCNADGADSPDARFTLTCTFATATSITGKAVQLWARPLDTDSTTDDEAPETAAAGFRETFIGNFLMNDVTSAQTHSFLAREVPFVADYYIYNATGQTISAGWVLKVTPIIYGQA